MIEGVNASIASASVARVTAVQADAAVSYAENPTQVQRIAQAPYVSPYISMDYTYDKAVLQIRDSDSGEVVRQIPTDSQLRAYNRSKQVAQTAPKEDPIDRKVEAEARATSSTKTDDTSSSQKGGAAADAAQVASVLISA
jgi:uncharacterized FlaG/YvyC family protein